MQNDMREFKAWVDKKYQEEQTRDRLVELLKKADENTSAKAITDYEDALLDNAEYLIANDVVPVVRCEQCKHWNNGDCYRIELTRPYDYCSYGERK